MRRQLRTKTWLMILPLIAALSGVPAIAGAATCPAGVFPAVNPASLVDPQAAITADFLTPILDANSLKKYVTKLPNPLAPSFIYTPAGTQGGEQWLTVSERQISQSIGLIYNNPANAADPNNGCTAPNANFWVYGDARDNGTTTAPSAGHSYPSPTIEVTAGTPTRITWTNELPATHIVNVDPTLDCGPNAPNCWPHNRTVVHVHGSHVADNSDGHPDAWFTAGFATTGHTWTPGTQFGPTGTYRYENTNEASTLWYHDHAMGLTHLNAYAGLAGFYIVRDANEKALQAPLGAAPAVLPTYPFEVPIVIQDKVSNVNGQPIVPDKPLQDFNALVGGVACNPLAAIGAAGACPTVKFSTDPKRPGALVPNTAGTLTAPSITPEFFGNLSIVNGQAWPVLDVEKRVYRLRLLNGSDSRTYIMRLMLKNNATGALTAAPAGLDIWQIGTEQGFLNSPVKPMVNDPSVALPPALPPFPQTNAVVLMPGERTDLLVDFKNAAIPAGSTLILQNIGPDMPYTGEYPPTATVGAVAGNGQMPTTILPELMAFNVLTTLSATADTLAPTLIGTAGQRGLRAAAITPLVDTVGTTPKKLYLAERKDKYGRLQLTVNGVDYMQAITELTKLNDVETWEIYNLTPDAHPMHLHLVAFQLVNRQNLLAATAGVANVPAAPYAPPPVIPAINTAVDPKTFVLDTAVGSTFLPAGNELNSWKDTLFMPPSTVTRVRAKFDIPGLYVEHCHILSHEESDMMRPFVVTTPATAVNLTASTPTTTQMSGGVTPVTFTASAQTGLPAYPETNGFEYKFSVKDPAGKVSQIDNMTQMVPGTTAGYSLVREAMWTPPSKPGTYAVTVEAKAIGAPATAPNVVTASMNYIITAPEISGITSTTATGSYKAGSPIDVSLTFNQPISSTGLTIALNSGGSVKTAAIANATSHKATYQVAAGENAASLAVTSITGTITDAAGNNVANPAVPAASNISGIVVDTAPPVITLNIPTATGALVNKTPLTLDGIATDNDAIQTFTVNGTAATLGTGGAITATSALVEGTNTITVLATDVAGNSTTVTRQVQLHTTPPALAVTAPLYVATAAANLTGTVSSAVGIKSCTVNNAPVTIGTGGAVTFPLTLANGANTLTIVATDNAGNTTQDTRSVGLVPGVSIGSCDLDADGSVTIKDAVKALQMSVGLATPTIEDLARADVAPFANGKPNPDGAVDTGDVLVILKRSVGLLTW